MFRYLNKLVDEFITDKRTADQHKHDLRRTSLVVFNIIVDCVRKGHFRGQSLIDVILDVSEVIEETTLMRTQMKEDESLYKRELVYWYVEDDDGKVQYRKPTKAKTFGQFRNKKNHCPAKSYAIELVAKAYRLDRISRYQDVKPEWTVAQLDKALDEKKITEDQWREGVRTIFDSNPVS